MANALNQPLVVAHIDGVSVGAIQFHWTRGGNR